MLNKGSTARNVTMSGFMKTNPFVYKCLVLTMMVLGQFFTAALERKCISSHSFFSVRMRAASLVLLPRLS